LGFLFSCVLALFDLSIYSPFFFYLFPRKKIKEMSDLNKVSLIDTSEEEQASLVQNNSSEINIKQEHDSLLEDNVEQHAVAPEKKQQTDEAIITTTAEEEDWENDKKEHPLASLSLEEYENNDPWAAQPEDNALLQAEEGVEEEEEALKEAETVLIQQPIATATVFDVDNQQEPIVEEELDEDTSAIKVIFSYILFD
jgi:hypothetical protein